MALAPLPKHDVMGPIARAVEAGSIALAAALLVANALRVARIDEPLSWWSPLAFAAGAVAADLVSGLVHWFADSWGSDSMPVLGRRLLRPFRVHHVNPDDFLGRDFIDCNGDVAAIACLPLLGALAAPAPLATFLLAFAAVSLPTNQVHQWAHRLDPPRPVAGLQRWGVILSRGAHARHHRAPHVANYCIATGWCNPALEALGFFAALERAVTALTGLEPRSDDRGFAERAGSAA